MDLKARQRVRSQALSRRAQRSFPAAEDYEELEFEDGNEAETAEEIELLVRCIRAARQSGA